MERREELVILLKNKELEIKKFIFENVWVFFLQLMFIAFVVGIGMLYNSSRECLCYICSMIFFMEIITDFFWYRNCKKLLRTSEPTDMKEEEENQKLQELKEKEDFFVMWAHQIKTPIAALNLLLQSEDINIPTCKQEVFQIENYVELALNYLRFESMGNDLVLSRYSLEELTRQVVKKYAPVFINKHLPVKMQNLDVTILTDDKWFSLVLEQILSNALKYTREGDVSIWAVQSEQVELHIKDTGIGIQQEDLPRIFEKGFTGYNGRSDKKASGLGLYLAKGICDKLGHEIKIQSQVNKGTEAIITLGIEKVNNTDLTKM